MKTISILPVLLLVTLISIPRLSSAQVRVDLDTFHQEWKKAQYPKLIRDLPNYSKQAINGRNPVVYYYLATAYCRTNGFKDDARKHYQTLLSRFRLGRTFKTVALKEMSSCITRSEPSYMETDNSLALGDILRGKILRPMLAEPDMQRSDLIEPEAMPLRSSKTASTGRFQRRQTRITRTITEEEHQSRLFTPDQSDQAISKIRDGLGQELDNQGYSWGIRATDHFLIVGVGKAATPASLDRATKVLENSFSFYQRIYGMQASPYLMTIYLPDGDDAQMHLIADQVHGLDIDTRATWGYAMDADQSVVAKTTDGAYFGTLNHELFHLLAHQYFGDIPAWLDEGIASLYEATRTVGPDGDLKGIGNWRGPVLKEHWNTLGQSGSTKIEELIQTDWEQLDQAKMDKDKEAAILAMARYFAFYLQERDQLGALYREMQKLTPDKMEVGPQEDTKRLVLKVLGMSFEEIDADFAKWFKSL